MEMYQDARVKELEEQRELINYTAWLQGQYNLTAIGSALSKKAHYPKQPFAMREKQSGLSGEEQFVLWIAEYNRRFG